MKNKRVLYIFLVLFFVVLIVLFSSVLFSVKVAEVDFKGENTALSEQDFEGIRLCIRKTVGKNIFFINEDEITAGLEKSYPYINILNIERIFPSKVILHITERQELYCVKRTAQDYAVTDTYGKVVALKNSLGESDIILNAGGEITAEVSDKLTNSAVQYGLNLYESFISLGENTVTDFRNFAKEVTVTGSLISIKTRFGAVVNISDCGETLTGKVRLMYGAFNGELNDIQKAQGIINITSETEYTISK